MEYEPMSRTEALIEEPISLPPPQPVLLRLTAPVDVDPRENGTQLDALPYIDAMYSEEAQEEVNALISAEMARSTKSPEEYLKALNLPRPELKLTPLAEAEFSRLESGRPQVPVDMARYKVEPPPEEERNNVDAWRRAVDNAYAQLQGTKLRLVNLELTNKFGPNAWKMHTEQLQSLNQGLEDQIMSIKQEIENVNRKRKTDQAKVGGKLEHLEEKWTTSIQKTNELEGVCFLLEKEVRKLRKRAIKRGLMPGEPDEEQQQPVPVDET